MKLFYLLLCLTALCSCNKLLDATIDSQLELCVTTVNNNNKCVVEDDFSSWEFVLSASQKLRLPSIVDTLALQLRIPQVFPADGLGVNVLSVLDSKGKLLEYEYDYKELKINTESCSDITIKYKVLFPNFLQNCVCIENSYISEIYQQNTASWFFEADGMRLSRMRVKSPSNAHKVVSYNSTVLDKNAVAILDKTFYKKHETSANGKRINLYVHSFQEDTIIVDTLMKVNNISELVQQSSPRNQNEIDGALKIAKTACEEVGAIFGDNHEMQLNIIERLWGNDEVAMGNTVSSNMIIVDKSMTCSSSLIHEIVHTYDGIDYQMACTDSSRYLFSESMIEYLTWYIAEKHGIPFNDGTDKATKQEESIFKVKKNDQSTMRIIYFDTPHRIRSFSKSVGEDIFIHAYSEFHRGGMINVQSFAKCLVDAGISQNEVQQFLESL